MSSTSDTDAKNGNVTEEKDIEQNEEENPSAKGKGPSKEKVNEETFERESSEEENVSESAPMMEKKKESQLHADETQNSKPEEKEGHKIERGMKKMEVPEIRIEGASGEVS